MALSDWAMPAMGTPQMAISTIKEEWKCVSMEHLEQSVMWVGTSWMPKWLVANLAIMVSTDAYVIQCSLKYVILLFLGAQVLNGSNLGPWYGSVFLENVTCNGTERLGIECLTPGSGIVTSPECYNPNRTAGVRCFTGKQESSNCHLTITVKITLDAV